MSATRLVLARHGETTANVEHVLSSRPPGGPLTELGLAQAAALGERLAGEPVISVHASRAIRAQQTAAPVAAAHGLDVQVVDGIHEVFVGDLEDHSDEAAQEEFAAVYEAWQRGELHVGMPGGESALDVRERFLPVVEKVVAAAPADTVVVVSHGAAIRIVAATLLGVGFGTRYVPNTGLVVLAAQDGGGWTLEHWDDAPPVVGDVTAGGAAE
jgi:broad specificity phosphatase PhoE